MSKIEKTQHQGKPDLDDNDFTQVANEYLEVLYTDPLIDLRTKIRFYIQRWTWGYGVKTRDLSQARMAKEIGVHRSHLNRAIKELVASKRINVTKYGNKKKLTFSINKYYRQWIDTQPDVKDVTKYGNIKLPYLVTSGGSAPLYVNISSKYKEGGKTPAQEKSQAQAQSQAKIYPTRAG